MYIWYMAQYVMNGFRELPYNKNHLFVQIALQSSYIASDSAVCLDKNS